MNLRKVWDLVDLSFAQCIYGGTFDNTHKNLLEYGKLLAVPIIPKLVFYAFTVEHLMSQKGEDNTSSF